MATLGQWIEGARLRTLPLAIAPVLIGAGAALGSLGGLSAVLIGSVDSGAPATLNFAQFFLRVVLALLVSLGLQIGSNYANDYSDGIRGTDDVRVGPLRLTASGAAAPATVKRAAFASFAVAGVAGFGLAIISQSWWLIPVGVVAVLSAWYYTGGKHPYGYIALGELFVFIFFGLVATLGTAYALVHEISWWTWSGAVGIGLFACAVLMVNNLRDIPTDTQAGKTTLAVVLGDQNARYGYGLLVFLPYLLLVIPAVTGHPGAVLAVLSLALTVAPLKTVLGNEEGRALIPSIKHTGIAALTYSALLALGLAL